MTSFGYLDQKGIIKRTDYQRYNVRNNMNIDFSDKLSMRFDVSSSRRSAAASRSRIRCSTT